MPVHNQYDIEDTNIFLIGTDIDHKVKYNSAATEPAWNDGEIGTHPGLRIWRIENFHVIPWPKQLYGQFYDGDSYIVLYSYIIPQRENDGLRGSSQQKLGHDIFFWLGSKTTQDEAGTAAYKTVELDEFLHGIATQHRETQLHPSDEFVSLFPRLSIRKGGVRSGFHHVDQQELQPKGITTLLRIFKHPATSAAEHGHSTVVHEVEPTWQSLDDGDVFVLEKDDKIWVWQGKDCSPMEKAKAAQVVNDLTLAKHIDVEVLAQTDARSKIVVDLLGGNGVEQSSFRSRRPIRSAATSHDMSSSSAPSRPQRLLRIITNDAGQFQFELDKEGDSVRFSDLNSDDIFIYDTGKKIWVWEGSQVTREKKDAWKVCTGAYLRYLQQQESQSPDVIAATPVAKVVEGYENPAFIKAISI